SAAAASRSANAREPRSFGRARKPVGGARTRATGFPSKAEQLRSSMLRYSTVRGLPGALTFGDEGFHQAPRPDGRSGIHHAGGGGSRAGGRHRATPDVRDHLASGRGED